MIYLTLDRLAARESTADEAVLAALRQFIWGVRIFPNLQSPAPP
jgi:hypothetical protein